MIAFYIPLIIVCFNEDMLVTLVSSHCSTADTAMMVHRETMTV